MPAYNFTGAIFYNDQQHGTDKSQTQYRLDSMDNKSKSSFKKKRQEGSL